MKKFLLTLCLGVAALGASAATYLHLQTSTGWQVIDLEQVDRLTFSGGVMTAQNAQGATVGTYPQSSLEQIIVNDTAGLDKIAAADEEASFEFKAATMSVKMLADGAFEVYGLDGKQLVSIPAKAGEEIAVGALRSTGTVIMKSGNYAIKATVR